MGRGRVDREPNSPLGFTGRESGSRGSRGDDDWAGSGGLAQDDRVQRAGHSRGRRSTWQGSGFLLAAVSGRVGRACAQRAKEQSINEAYHLSNGEVNREHLGRVSNQ